MSEEQNLVALVYCSALLRHVDRSIHPERPERLSVTYAEICRRNLIEDCVILPARRATAQELRRCHDAAYVSAVFALGRKCLQYGNEMDQLLSLIAKKQDSIYLNEFSVDCALLAAGCAIDAARAILLKQVKYAVALVRPPGHHATPTSMMGFCLFNNAAIAVSQALAQGINRILIFDWDAHHGNGTQDIFASDPRLLFVSLHRHDEGRFYPVGKQGAPESVGIAPAQGYSINIGWNGAGAGDSEYLTAYDQFLLPMLEQFKPEFVVISAGFDSARGDPLGGCDLTPQGYATLLHRLKLLHNQPPLLLVLEGGYNCASVANSVAACLETLLLSNSKTPPPPDANGTPSPMALRAIARTARAHWPFWPSLRPHFNKVISKADDLRRPASSSSLRFGDEV